MSKQVTEESLKKVLELQKEYYDQRVETLEESLQADKTNLKNFKQNVTENYVDNTTYNNDKATIMSQIIQLQKDLKALQSN